MVFQTLWAEALAYNDIDAYVSDMALSSLWGDEPEAEVPEERIEWLRKLWEIRHEGVPALRYYAGLTQQAFSGRFGIPLRTVESWHGKSASKRECPDYVLAMMTELLIKP